MGALRVADGSIEGHRWKYCHHHHFQNPHQQHHRSLMGASRVADGNIWLWMEASRAADGSTAASPLIAGQTTHLAISATNISGGIAP
jgi:hypothetical protein